MASLGLQTSSRPRLGRKTSRIAQEKRRFIVRFLARGIASLALFFIAVACAPTIEYGAKPQTDALETLTIASSTSDEIRLALGEPRGHGVARFAEDLIPRDLWFYEYVKSDGRAIDLKILVVLLKENRYDGHFWFSSVELIDPFQY